MTFILTYFHVHSKKLIRIDQKVVFHPEHSLITFDSPLIVPFDPQILQIKYNLDMCSVKNRTDKNGKACIEIDSSTKGLNCPRLYCGYF